MNELQRTFLLGTASWNLCSAKSSSAKASLVRNFERDLRGLGLEDIGIDYLTASRSLHGFDDLQDAVLNRLRSAPSLSPLSASQRSQACFELGSVVSETIYTWKILIRLSRTSLQQRLESELSLLAHNALIRAPWISFLSAKANDVQSVDCPTSVQPLVDSVIAELNHYDVFISHAKHDSQEAHQLWRHLESEGLRTWIAEEHASSPDFDKAMAHALKLSRLVVLVWSCAATTAEGVRQEIALARKMQRSLILYRLDKTDIGQQWRDLLTTDYLYVYAPAWPTNLIRANLETLLASSSRDRTPLQHNQAVGLEGNVWEEHSPEADLPPHFETKIQRRNSSQ